MVNRLVSVGEDFKLPAAVIVENANLPAGLQPAALNATYAQQWKANTAYAAGQPVVNPAGDTVTAKVAFTSASTYNAANWNYSATYALKSELSAAGIKVVYHLANATEPRPSTTGPVLWVGSVAPVNRIAGDQYFLTTLQAVEPTINWLASFTASSIALADASAVTTWEDESANNYDLTQATAGSRPTFYAAAGANPAYVRFGGAHSLVGAAFGTAPTQPYSLFAAVRHNTLTVTAGSFNTVVTGIAASQFTLRARGQGTTSLHSAEAGTSGEFAGAITAGQWYVISVIFDGTLSSFGVNGVSVGKSLGANAPTGLRVGSSYTGASSFLNGDIHALRFVPGRIDNPDRRSIEQSLADAVGVTLA